GSLCTLPPREELRRKFPLTMPSAARKQQLQASLTYPAIPVEAPQRSAMCWPVPHLHSISPFPTQEMFQSPRAPLSPTPSLPPYPPALLKLSLYLHQVFPRE